MNAIDIFQAVRHEKRRGLPEKWEAGEARRVWGITKTLDMDRLWIEAHAAENDDIILFNTVDMVRDAWRVRPSHLDCDLHLGTEARSSSPN